MDKDLTRISLKEAAEMGRGHGKLQRNSTTDHMLFEFQFPSRKHWDAYTTGFYRGCGYGGSSNRRLRAFAKETWLWRTSCRSGRVQACEAGRGNL